MVTNSQGEDERGGGVGEEDAVFFLWISPPFLFDFDRCTLTQICWRKRRKNLIERIQEEEGEEMNPKENAKGATKTMTETEQQSSKEGHQILRERRKEREKWR